MAQHIYMLLHITTTIIISKNENNHSHNHDEFMNSEEHRLCHDNEM